jgi:hypothetical protein
MVVIDGILIGDHVDIVMGAETSRGGRKLELSYDSRSAIWNLRNPSASRHDRNTAIQILSSNSGEPIFIGAFTLLDDSKPPAEIVSERQLAAFVGVNKITLVHTGTNPTHVESRPGALKLIRTSQSPR